MKAAWRTLILLWLLAGAASAPAQVGVSARLTQVLRGDELAVQIDTWIARVRLHGVFVPRDPSSLDRHVQAYLRRRIGDGRLRLVVRGTAAKNVLFADVFAPPSAKQSVNAELVRVGLARWSEKYAPDRIDLQQAEDDARSAGRGLWTDPSGANVRLPLAGKRPTAAPRQRRGFVAKATALPAVRAHEVPASPVVAPRDPIRAWIGFGGVALSAVLLGVAALLCQPALRVRSAPRQLVADAAAGWMKIRGVARAHDDVLLSAAGRFPALFLHETTWRFAPVGPAGRREYRWTKLREERESVPFVLDDGSGKAVIETDPGAYFPGRVARFYNEVPVLRWHDRAYPDDTRTELRLLPPDAPVIVVGRGEWRDDRLTVTRALVIEGDESHVGRSRARAAISLGLAAVTLFAASLFALLTGGGS